jgi:hypothetical protein
MPSTSPGARATPYAHNGRFDDPDTEFVPDEVVDRSCLPGAVGDHLAVLRELEALGGDQFKRPQGADDPASTGLRIEQPSRRGAPLVAPVLVASRSSTGNLALAHHRQGE